MCLPETDRKREEVRMYCATIPSLLPSHVLGTCGHVLHVLPKPLGPGFELHSQPAALTIIPPGWPRQVFFIF